MTRCRNDGDQGAGTAPPFDFVKLYLAGAKSEFSTAACRRRVEFLTRDGFGDLGVDEV